MKNLFAFKLPSLRTTFPIVYGGNQIIAEVSHWTMATKIRVNDEIIDKKNIARSQTIDDEKVSQAHTFNLPNGEEVIVTTGASLSDGMLFCLAEAGGIIFYEKSDSKGASEPDVEPEPLSLKKTLMILIPAGVAGGVMGYVITQFILGAF